MEQSLQQQQQKREDTNTQVTNVAQFGAVVTLEQRTECHDLGSCPWAVIDKLSKVHYEDDKW